MSESTLRIGLILPQVLGTYGDGGNSVVLQARAQWRGIEAAIVPCPLGQPMPRDLDLYTIGGGEDTAQRLAVEYLGAGGALAEVVSAGKPVLAICAAMQVLGKYYVTAAGERVPGVGVIDVITLPQGRRAIGELVTKPLVDGLTEPLTGFENHGGATLLGPGVTPVGEVLSGVGNGSAPGEVPAGYRGGAGDGVAQGNLIATYMHGPVLARNPQLADWLLARATGVELGALAPLQVPHAAAGEVPGIAELRAERLAAAGR